MLAKLNPKSRLQHQDVVLGRVKYLLYGLVGQNSPQRPDIMQPQRIQQVVDLDRADLDQADAIVVTVEAVGLRVKRQGRLGGQGVEHQGEGSRRVDQHGRRKLLWRLLLLLRQIRCLYSHSVIIFPR